MNNTMKAILVALVVLLVPVFGLAEEKPMLDRYLDQYWGQKREVKVIQKRLFMKDGRHEFGVFFGTIPNDEFLMYYPLGLRYNYYFSEDIGIELFGSYLIEQQSDLADFLSDRESGFGIAIKTHLPQILVWTAGLEGLWSPIHGKIGVFTTKLAHFDWHLALGAGAIGTTVSTREEGGDRKSKTDVAGNIGTGLRFYLADWAALRLEYRNYFYAAEAGGVSYPAEITIGAAFFTK